MKAYKITNITHLLGKRNVKYNTELDAEYVDGMMKKTLTIKPQESTYLSLQTLPISIHRLRIKGLVTVKEISDKEMKNIIKLTKTANKIKALKEEPKVEEAKEEPKVEEAKEEHKVEETEDESTKKTTKKTKRKYSASDDKSDVDENDE